MLNPKENREIWMKAAIEHKDLLEGRAAEAIEKYRKGWCKLRFVDEQGNPLKSKKIVLNQQTHDFKYGANIFMLDEFDNESDNQKYREIFKKYFNLHPFLLQINNNAIIIPVEITDTARVFMILSFFSFAVRI